MTKQEACEKFKEYIGFVRENQGSGSFSMDKSDIKQTRKDLELLRRDINDLYDTHVEIFVKIQDGRRFQLHEGRNIRSSAIRVVRIEGKIFRVGDSLIIKPEEIDEMGDTYPFIKTTKKLELVGFYGKKPVLSFDGRFIALPLERFYDKFELE